MQDKIVKETKKPAKIVSRREFIKDAGLIVGGAALGSVALVNACSGSTTETVTETATVTKTQTTTQMGSLTITKQAETSTLPPVTTTVTAQPVTTTVTSPPTTVTALATISKSGYIKWDSEKCLYCGRCLMMCAVSHHGAVSPQLSSIRWVEEDYFADFPNRKPLMCQQCAQPECYYACPLKDEALCVDAKTGARYIDTAKCSGCGLCIPACPFEVSRISLAKVSDKDIAIKCDLCKNRANGPVCIEMCNAKALTFITKEGRV